MSLNTFERAKVRQNFKQASTRPCCQQCEHCHPLKPDSGFRCMKGGFFVTAYAVCDIFQVKGPTS